jgi:arginine:ornithine antiporter / lysine permease
VNGGVNLEECAFNLALKKTSPMTLIPYLLVAAYGLTLARIGETYAEDAHSRAIDRLRSSIATLY